MSGQGWQWNTTDFNEVQGGLVGNVSLVLYQWKDFPTHEVRVTPIKNLSMKNVEVEEADRLVHILGDARCPVDGVTVENVKVGKLHKADRIENAANVKVSKPVAADVKE